MKSLTMLFLATILWQGTVPDLGMDTGRVVVSDDGTLVAEVYTTHIDSVGEQVSYWEKAGATEKSIYKEAMLQMSSAKPVKQKKSVPIKILGELDRLLTY